MSYILNALEKAEREKAIKQTPGLMTTLDFRGMRRQRNAAVAGALIICFAAALLIFLNRPPAPSPAGAEQNRPANRLDVERTTDSPAVNAASSSVPTAALSQETAVPASSAASQRKEIGPNDAASRALEAARGAGQSPQTLPSRQGAPVPLNPLAASRESVPGLSSAEPAATKEASPASGAAQRTYPSLREAITKMVMTILLYDENESGRKVYINGRGYVKGDLVDGLYLVESITRDGAILSFGGERLLLRIKSN